MMILAVCQVFFTKILLFVMEAVFARHGTMQNGLDQFQAMAPMAAAPMLVGLLIVRGEVGFFLLLGFEAFLEAGFFLVAITINVSY
jgi:hypothetical protein